MTARNAVTISKSSLLILCVIFTAANLRAPITVLPPLLSMVRETFSLESAIAGAIMTLPLLAFAIVSPFCVLLARKYGLERSLFLAMVLIAGGVALRPSGTLWGLFAGTAVIGVGIAIANVLLPGLLKREFPDRIAAMTSAYAFSAGMFAALSSSVAVPLAMLPGWSWASALSAFILFPLVAVVLWLPRLSSQAAPPLDTKPQAGRVWHSPLAWQVTAYFGLNSLVYYVTITWLPAILASKGYTLVAAGSLHGVSQLATAIPGLFLGPLLSRLRDQKAIAAIAAIVTAVSLTGLLVLPSWAVVWTAMFGFGTGATFILGLAFMSLRAASVAQAAALSSMAQTVGYSVASAAPPLVGLLHDRSGGWSAALGLGAVLCGTMAVLGYRAGESAHI